MAQSMARMRPALEQHMDRTKALKGFSSKASKVIEIKLTRCYYGNRESFDRVEGWTGVL